MHRRGFCQGDAQKGSQGQAVRTAPSYAALAIQTFEVTDEQPAEINPGRNARSAAFLVIRGAELFHKIVKTGGRQNLVELGLKGMTRTGRQFGRGDEQFVLLGLRFPSAIKIRRFLHPVVQQNFRLF
jgi:hypothetical protein